MFPPTPTPFPTELAPPITIPALDAWDFTANGIQTWNSAAAVTVFFQAMVIVACLFFIYKTILKMAQYLSKEKSI